MSIKLSMETADVAISIKILKYGWIAIIGEFESMENVSQDDDSE